MMKTIYKHIATRPPGEWMPHTGDHQIIEEIDGHRFKVTIRFDTFYKSQSRGAIAHLIDGRFHHLADLTADEIPCVRSWYDQTPGQARGDWLRSGDAFEKTIEASLVQLACRGALIVGVMTDRFALEEIKSKGKT